MYFQEESKKKDFDMPLNIGKIFLHVNSMSVCLIDDCADSDVPLAEFAMKSIVMQQHFSKNVELNGDVPSCYGGKASFTLSGDYYNRWAEFKLCSIVRAVLAKISGIYIVGLALWITDFDLVLFERPTLYFVTGRIRRNNIFFLLLSWSSSNVSTPHCRNHSQFWILASG